MAPIAIDYSYSTRYCTMVQLMCMPYVELHSSLLTSIVSDSDQTVHRID